MTSVSPRFFFSLPTILRWNKFALFPHFFRLVFFPVACPISNHFHVTKVCSFGHDGGGGENCLMLFFLLSPTRTFFILVYRGKSYS